MAWVSKEDTEKDVNLILCGGRRELSESSRKQIQEFAEKVKRESSEESKY